MTTSPESVPAGSRGHCPTCSCAVQPGHDNVRDDPRWRLAQAEFTSCYPELDYRLTHVIRSVGIDRMGELELLHELGFHGVRPPSFSDEGWRSPALRESWRKHPEPPEWDPDNHGDYWRRIVCYHVQLSLGRTPREAVELLASSRRAWHAQRTAAHAEWLRDRHANRVRIGVQRHIRKLKAAVMAAGGPCTYCGDPDPKTVDHIVPTSRGGVDHPTNLTIACALCNNQKNNRTPEEWKAAWLAAGRPWPPAPSTATVRKAS